MKQVFFLIFIFITVDLVFADVILCQRFSLEQKQVIGFELDLSHWDVEFKKVSNKADLKCNDMGDNAIGAWVTCKDEATNINVAFFETSNWPFFEGWVWLDTKASQARRFDCEIIKQEKWKNQEI